MPVLCGTALSGKRMQCPWNGYRPVLRVVFSKLTDLHQKRNFFRQLGWPALRWRREITSLTMFHNSYTAVRNHSANVCSSTQVPPQLVAAASHSNCSSQTHAPHATENFFYRSALLWNSLQHDIQSLNNSKSFRDALENHYPS